MPVLLNRVCDKCGEQRCKKHCKCGRDKENVLKGRSSARGYDGFEVARVQAVGKAKAKAKAKALPEPVVAPVGRASPPGMVMLAVADWYKECCSSIKSASQVELATYQYDNIAVQTVLLERLRGRRGFTLNLYIDIEQFNGKTPRSQKTFLTQLQTNGASIYLCKGPGPRGAYHSKACVIDRRVVFSGNANFTQKSLSNEEFCYKASGPVVLEFLERLAVHRTVGKLWLME